MRRLRRLLRTWAMLLMPSLRATPSWVAIAMSFQITQGVSAALYPYGFALFVDGALHRNAGGVAFAAGFVAVLYVVSWGTGFLGNTSTTVLTQRTDLYLGEKIAQLVNEAPTLEHFERPDYLRELDLLTRDRRILASATQQVSNLLFIAARTIVMLTLLATVNPFFVLLPLAAVLPAVGSSYAARRRKQSDDSLAESIRLANDLFALSAAAAPAKELRIFGLIDELGNRHERLARQIVETTRRATLVGSLAEGIGWTLFALGFIGVVAGAVVQAIHGHATPGQVLMAVVLAQNLQSQLGRATGGAGQLNRARKTAERYLWLEDHAKRVAERGEKQPAPLRLKGGISFEHVDFSYPGTEELALEDVTFHLPAGSSVALIGENGAGKTTIAKLIARMYDPTRGRIAVDGVDLSDLDRDDWRGAISGTFQDFVRFELQVAQTVGIGDLPRIDDRAAVLDAVARAGSADLLDQLGDQPLEQLVGRSFADGRELSGGQWQKLALARGRMRDAPLVLILDEPTASLDAMTEHAIFERHLDAARDAAAERGAITLLVSHRFSTVRMADLILVIERGRVVEQGSHDELIRRGGIYAQLYAIQERAFLSGADEEKG